MRRRYAAAAILLTLLAGHALGQVLPADKVASAPFVHSATVGELVHLPYADLRLTGLVIAEQMSDGSRTVKPAGRYLVMDVEMTARGEPLAAALPYVRDAEGRRYRADDVCATAVAVGTGIPTSARVCIDISRAALPGAVLVIGRGAEEIEGNRRDAIAEFDVGLADAAQAEALWSAPRELASFRSGPVPPRDWLGR